MIYDHMVKKDGVLYMAGQEVPETASPKPVEPKKEGKPSLKVEVAESKPKKGRPAKK